MARPRNNPGRPIEGKRIRIRRMFDLDPPLTSVELGERVGVSGTTVREWERGERQPTPDQLRALVRALGCRAGDLAR